MRHRILLLQKQWRHFWFEPATPFNLGFCRILFFGGIFLFYLQSDFSAWAEVDKFFWKPIWLFKSFHLPVLTQDSLAIIQFIWKAGLGLSCIGLFTRMSTIASFVLGIYLIGLPHNFGKVNHSDAILVFIMGVMVLSRCGDSLSVDRLLLRLRSKKNQSPAKPAACGEYTWPIRVVWLIMALVFFAAGVSKIGRSGLEWVMSDNMAILLIERNYGDSPLTSWGLYIAQYRWLCWMFAAGTIVFEACFPLALISRRARWIIVPAMTSIQIGIAIILGPGFRQFMLVYLFWIPWDRVGPFVRSVGVIGIILVSKPGWAVGLARMAGIEHGVELFIYLGLSGFAFICLIYYAARGVWNPLKQT